MLDQIPTYARKFALELDRVTPSFSHFRQGAFICGQRLLADAATLTPTAQVLGAKRGVIFSKKLHRFWLFQDGVLHKTGVASFANYKAGAQTPVGLFRIFRKGGPDCTSVENPDPTGRPNMRYSLFLHTLDLLRINRGIAIHAGVNILQTRCGTLYPLDSSKGCVHVSLCNAELLHDTLKSLKDDGFADRVLILPRIIHG